MKLCSLVNITLVFCLSLFALSNASAKNKSFYAESDYAKTEELACKLAKIQAMGNAGIYGNKHGYNVPKVYYGECNCLQFSHKKYKCEVKVVATLKRP